VQDPQDEQPPPQSRDSRSSYQPEERPRDGRSSREAEASRDYRNAPPPNEEGSQNRDGQSEAPISDGATSFLVEDFLEAKKIDKVAGDQFRKCRREVQLSIIGKADFKHVLNPATHLFSLIGETEARAPDPSKYIHVEKIVAFVKRWSLNVDAQAKILCLSPDVQLVVMAEFNPPADMLNVNGKFILFAGSLQTAEICGKFNPRQPDSSSHVHALGDFSFMQNSARSVESGGQALRVASEPPPPPPPENNDRERVEDFINNSGVDEDAAYFLRACPPDIQLKVVGLGKLKFALSTPSAALLARIKSVNGCLPSVEPSFAIQAPPPAAPAPEWQVPQPMQQASLPRALMAQQQAMQQDPRQGLPVAMSRFQEKSLEDSLKKSLGEMPALKQGWENNLPAFLRKRAKLGIVGPISGPTLPLPPADTPPPLPEAAPPPAPDESAPPTPSLKMLWHR